MKLISLKTIKNYLDNDYIIRDYVDVKTGIANEQSDKPELRYQKIYIFYERCIITIDIMRWGCIADCEGYINSIRMERLIAILKNIEEEVLNNETNK